MPAPSGRDTRHAGVMHGDLWEELVARIEQLHPLVWGADVPDDPVVKADGLRYLLRFVASGITICVAHDDTETPEFGRMIENRTSWGLDNPDCLYSYTRVRGDASYRVSGSTGSARHLELQVNTGHYSDGDFTGWQAVSALSSDELRVEADGTFEVVLSPEQARPNDAANWMRVDDTASFLVLRQYFGDWETEQPADVIVEQIDYPYPPPVPTTDEIGGQVELLLQWLDRGARCWDEISRGIMRNPPGDIQPFLPPASASGLKGQAYGMGSWRCARDEAVILELAPPEGARLWSLSLCDRYWQAIEFGARQSSLNSSQARLGEDGSFVGVLAHHDPGVANWLDPGGHEIGSLAVRYLFDPAVIDGGDEVPLPPVRYRTVPLADLATALDPAVPRITRDERRNVLERRRRALTRRYRR